MDFFGIGLCRVLHQVKRKEEAYNKGKYVLDQQVAGSKSRAEDEERRLDSQNGTVESLDRMTAENKAATDVLRVQIEVCGFFVC